MTSTSGVTLIPEIAEPLPSETPPAIDASVAPNPPCSGHTKK
jgi:hypothetical protein